MFTTKEEIIQWLQEMKVENTIIHPDLSVSVKGDLTFAYKNLKKIPIQLRKVEGHFACNGNGLTSLKGCPQWIGGNFYAHNNKIKTLAYFPETIIGSIHLDDNKLKTLKGFPENYHFDINISYNPLTSLENLPKVIKRDLNISGTKIKINEELDNIQVNEYLTISIELEEIEELKELESFITIIINPKGDDPRKAIFKGPFSEYKRIISKKELMKKLNQDLSIHLEKNQLKI